MAEPVWHEGAHWFQQSDGSWLRFDQTTQTWAAPPPGAAPPVTAAPPAPIAPAPTAPQPAAHAYPSGAPGPAGYGAAPAGPPAAAGAEVFTPAPAASSGSGKTLLIAGGIVLVALLAGGGYVLTRDEEPAPVAPLTQDVAIPTETAPAPAADAGSKSDYLATADALCLADFKEVEAEFPETFEDLAALGVHMQGVVAKSEESAAALEAIPQPSEDHEVLTLMFAENAATLALAREMADLAAANDEQGFRALHPTFSESRTRTLDLAAQYGFASCPLMPNFTV